MGTQTRHGPLMFTVKALFMWGIHASAAHTMLLLLTGIDVNRPV